MRLVWAVISLVLIFFTYGFEESFAWQPNTDIYEKYQMEQTLLSYVPWAIVSGIVAFTILFVLFKIMKK